MKTRGSRTGSPPLLLGLLQVDDQQALGHADLDRGKADAGRRVHRLEHVGDQRAQLVVDLLDRRGDLAEARVGNFEDAAEWPWRRFSLSRQWVQATGRRARRAWASVPSSR